MDIPTLPAADTNTTIWPSAVIQRVNVDMDENDEPGPKYGQLEYWDGGQWGSLEFAAIYGSTAACTADLTNGCANAGGIAVAATGTYTLATIVD